MLTLDPRGRIFRPGHVLIESGRIRRVGQGLAPDDAGAARLHLPGRLLMPGLVNAHTHSPMVLFRGLAEGHSLLTFEGWYSAIRSWELVLDPDWISPAVTASCAEMIRTGTTCFADQYFHMDRVVPAVRNSGLRAALAYGIVEMGDPAARERELAAAQAFLESVSGDPRLYGWIGPHAFFVDNAPETIAAELELADRYQAGLHIHLATSGEEDRYCQEHFGRSAVAEMEQLGVLRRRVLAAHCLTIPEIDLPVLASSPFSAVLCPSACMRSGAAAPPLAELRSAGVHLALGSDNVANNNSYDLFEEMRTLAKLAAFSQKRPAALPAADVLRMATLGGAAALGLEDEIGSLEPGKAADLIALDLTQVGWAPGQSQDLYTALVYSAGGMHVTDVMVAGRWLYRQGRWTTLDYPAAAAELEQAHAQLLQARAAVQEQP